MARQTGLFDLMCLLSGAMNRILSHIRFVGLFNSQTKESKRTGQTANILGKLSI